MKRPPYIRWMIRRDLPEVLAIEEASFECPWSADDFKRTLDDQQTIGLVAVDDSTFEAELGFVVYRLHRTFIEVLNFAVHQDDRRRGVGRAMFEKLTSKLAPHRRPHLVLDVVETNLEAQKFFAACGCRAVRVVRGRWADEQPGDIYQRDAYRFVYEVASPQPTAHSPQL